jgi:hypothetical protein
MFYSPLDAEKVCLDPSALETLLNPKYGTPNSPQIPTRILLEIYVHTPSHKCARVAVEARAGRGGFEEEPLVAGLIRHGFGDNEYFLRFTEDGTELHTKCAGVGIVFFSDEARSTKKMDCKTHNSLPRSAADHRPGHNANKEQSQEPST